MLYAEGGDVSFSRVRPAAESFAGVPQMGVWGSKLSEQFADPGRRSEFSEERNWQS